MLMSCYLKFDCQLRWCHITRFFKNRTENSLKNRFHLVYTKFKIVITDDKTHEL